MDGEGFLFAFSGMDGETCYAPNFVLTRHNTGYDFLVQTEFLHELRIRTVSTGELRAATSDVYAVQFGTEILALTFSAWHTLIGQLPYQTTVVLLNANGEIASPISACNAQGGMLAFAIEENRFAVAYGESTEEARARANTGLAMSIEANINLRLMVYEQLPHLADAGDDRFLRKCFSVMKVNALSAEAEFQQHWSTPDRVPHRDMWLWDSVFHSLAMNKVDPELSWEYLKTILDRQSEDGMISHQFKPNGWSSTITQPPILAWGIWENYQHNPSPNHLAYAAERLATYLQWDQDNRDQNRNRLLEWFIEENENCRSGESGMDNSQRFDEALLLDAVDFSVFAALDMGYLSRIYAELGDEEHGGYWKTKSTQLSTAIHTKLWNEEVGFYLDHKLNGNFSPVQAVTGFLPLLLEDFPPERLQPMVDALLDETRFNTAFPIPSVALNTPDFSTDMWRGATWINMNYLVAMGFERQGRNDLAEEIRAKTLSMVKKYYEQLGVIFEFYDTLDQVPPFDCDRKGPRQAPYNIRNKMDSIRDYHWSAALCFVMLQKG